MTVTSGVYKIENIINKKFYIGSAVKLSTRRNEHFCKLADGRHENIYLQRSCSKYGVENFVFTVVEYCDPSILLEKEQSYLDLYWSTGILYNICPNAGNCLGRPRSEETRRKISITFHNMSEEKKKERSLKLSNARKGRIISEESKRKTSLSKTGSHPSDETREKQSSAAKGKPKSEETKEKMRLAKQKMSNETKEKIRAAALRRGISDEVREKMNLTRLKNKILREEAKRSLGTSI